jgi:hypothetical protein
LQNGVNFHEHFTIGISYSRGVEYTT